MQVANALNNTIRILFNPKVEAFKLFDFLLVQSGSDRYLSQIIEIYDDKYDASQNVAKLKLFYKISADNEVMPYDNFTPNKECEITRVNQEGIEEFFNNNKKTFTLGTNVKNSAPFKVQYEFFNNNPIILADKIENSNLISINLAKNLSSEKNVVIIDFTGGMEYSDAKKIFSSKNFKMPLNYNTLDFVFEKCLKDSTLEFQAIGLEIENEIKKFARAQEGGFIPFNAFCKVIMAQYKATPYSELRLLLARIKKYQMDEIFAKNKKDCIALTSAISKNPITIIDLAKLSLYWQKAYLEYIISAIKEDVYLIVRINDENFDVNFINKIYNEKKNINFIPSVSYNYSKLPSLVQHCKNYVLLPSLNQRNDFLEANFALSNLIKEGCIIFGKNTDNFIYLIRGYEADYEDKKQSYRKIALSLMEDEEESVYLGGQKQQFQQYRPQEQRRFEPEEGHSPLTLEENLLSSNDISEEIDTYDTGLAANNSAQVAQNAPEEIEKTGTQIAQNAPDIDFEDMAGDFFLDAAEQISETSEIKENIENNENDENKNTADEMAQSLQTEQSLSEISKDTVEIAPATEEAKTEVVPAETVEPSEPAEIEETFEPATEEPAETSEPLDATDLAETLKQAETPAPAELSEPEEMLEFAEVSEIAETPKSEETAEPSEPFAADEENIELSDEELDFFETSDIEMEQENVTIDDIEYKVKSDDEDDVEESGIAQIQDAQTQENNLEAEDTVQNASDDKEESLSEIAESNVEDNFKDILNAPASEPRTEKVAVEPDILIPIEGQSENKKENLPIFSESLEEVTFKNKPNQVFETGEMVAHSKYGRGRIVKIIQYDQRQLLQIEFENSGKKLLDPKVTDINKI